jgi:hypothetical protein
MTECELKRQFEQQDKEFNAILLKDHKGELSRRIINEIDYDDKARQDDTVYFKGKNILKHSIIFNVLDEAKKEWLLIEDFRYNELGKGYISQEQARQDWFKKWFGSE